MTKTEQEMKALIEVLRNTKAESEKQFEESAEQFASLMAMKELGLVKGEQLETVNVAMVGALSVGSIIHATMEAIDEEIDSLEKALENYLSKTETTEEAPEKTEAEKILEMLEKVFGTDSSKTFTTGSK